MALSFSSSAGHVLHAFFEVVHHLHDGPHDGVHGVAFDLKGAHG